MNVWIAACRPKTLPAGAAPVLVGTALAAHDGVFDLGAAAFALVGALLLQVLSNLANDYFDAEKGADGPARLGPVRATAAGLVSKRAMRGAIAFVAALALLFGIALVVRGGWPIAVVGLSSIAAAVLYTGGPLPLGYKGLGEVFVFLFFGLVAVGGTYYVQALSLPSHAVLAGVAPGLLSAAILVVNNLRDIDGDARADKRTLAVRFGQRFARNEHTFLVVAGVFSALLLWPRFGLWTLLPLLTWIPARFVVIAVRKERGRDLNARLAQTAALLIVYSALFSLAAIGHRFWGA